MSERSTIPDSPSGKRRWLDIALTGLIVLAIAVALYFARAPARVERGPITAFGDMVPKVRAIIPSPTEYLHQLDLTGLVTLDRKLTVVSEVVGRVDWVSPEFLNGGAIPANSVFVRVDPQKYELEIKAAEMAVAAADARLRQARRGSGADAELVVAEAEARLGQAEAALDLAQLQLARTEISLPFAVRVMSSELEVGDLVGPPEAVGNLSRLGIVYRADALQVRVPIGVDDIYSLDPAIGRQAEVETESGTYGAELVRLSSLVAPESRLAHAFLKFSTNIPRETLPVPGTFAHVRIFGPVRSDVFVLPEAAERENGSVWIVLDGALRAIQPVTVGRTPDGWIVETFEPGEGLVVSALSGAREGLNVDVTPDSAVSSQ